MYNFYDLKKAIPVERREISLECPACHEMVNAVAFDGVVRGYCGNSNQEVRIRLDLAKKS